MKARSILRYYIRYLNLRETRKLPQNTGRKISHVGGSKKACLRNGYFILSSVRQADIPPSGIRATQNTAPS